MNIFVEKLKELGFNSYEAKVYLALLKKYPATGYEISQIASIPQSRAYDALKSLELEKVVLSTATKPQKYTPITPKELTQRYKRKLNSTIDYLEKKLPNVKEDYNEPIHQIVGYENIIKKAKEVIENSTKSLYIELWSTDYNQLITTLSNAYDRGVEIKFVGYDNFQSIFGLVYEHEGARELERQYGSRMFYLVSDNKETVFGKIEKEVVWSKNIEIAIMMKNFIVHDMYLADIYKQFPEQIKYFYGVGFKKLKQKILGNDKIC